jgi:hypothetical protein
MVKPVTSTKKGSEQLAEQSANNFMLVNYKKIKEMVLG